MENKIELKPCPFCGGEAMVIDTGDYFPVITYRVICKASCIMQGGLYKTKQEAIEAWNTRTDNAEQ